MIDYVIDNYKSKAKYINSKQGIRFVSSYKYQMVGHNANGFDNYIELYSLPSSYKCMKIIKTSRGF